LSEECGKQENDLTYISVPRRNNIFVIDDKKMKLNEFIETEFLAGEKAHKESQKHLREEEKTAFALRKKGYYQSQKRIVTLLFFRFNGSEKVSIIYTTSQTIFAKTLRRHWFNRTYIEQFFKTLKHVLKISEARTRNKEGLENKILQFAFLAIEVQKIIKFLRRKFSLFKGKGFISLQRILCSEQEIISLLQKQVDAIS
jgi:hypothetical protein